MHINYKYLLHKSLEFAADRPGARFLDYGCGAAQVVLAGRQAGLDF